MPFLDLSSNNAGGGFQGSPTLGAGFHTVTLTTLKYVTKADKPLAEFTDAEGFVHAEWFGTQEGRQKKRLAAFLSRLCYLCSVSHNLKFETMADFDKLGAALVATATPIQISLVESTWEGKTRIQMDGYFDHCLLAKTGTEEAF